jgi:hypothetical protein
MVVLGWLAVASACAATTGGDPTTPDATARDATAV